MAEVLLGPWLHRLDVPATVSSAGLLEGGYPVPDEVLLALEPYGLNSHGVDLSAYRSRRLSTEDVSGADLVIGMGRQHVREVVLLDSTSWSKSFTLRELVRRGEEVGLRRSNEPLAEWLAEAHRGRERFDLVGRSNVDDVADPYGGPLDGYQRTAAIINGLLGRLMAMLCPGPPEWPRQSSWGGK